MLATTKISLAAPVQKARLSARKSLTVSAVAQPSAPDAADFQCPLLRSGPGGKTSCVHPGRPVSQACGDCPRKRRVAAMAKSKCVHPQRPVSQACPDCPRRK